MGRLSLVVFVMAIALASCDGSPPRSSPSPTAPERDSPAPRTSSPQSRRFEVSRLKLELRPYVSGLNAPLLVTTPGDGSGRLFVVEQGGVIKIVEDRRVRSTFLDISQLVQAGGEQGLLGLAFHPRFGDNGRFFVNYTDTAGDTVIATYTAEPAAGQADPSSGEIVLKIDQPYSNHNGGHLLFGPDGYLYIGAGDGGGAGDPQENGQNKESLLGKLLRIDVAAGPNYSIPPDNPFAPGGGAGEVWAYGLRNPWRFSFDERTDTLWIGDVGQSVLEEINRVPDDEGGLNFGWNEMEGSRCYEGACDPRGKVAPVTEYGHDEGCSITGGSVYRGREFEDMQGGYFFADFCSGSMWAIDAEADGPVKPNLVLSSDHAISSFGTDEAGELFVTDLGSGEVLRVVDAE